MSSEDQPQYEPKDALSQMTSDAIVVGGFGAILAAVQNTLARQNLGPMGFLTRFGGTAATFTAMGASFGFVSNVTANLREKDDSWNIALGGFAAGSMVGLTRRTIPAFLGYGALLSVIMGVYDYTGGKLTGYDKDPNVDEVDRKEYLRKNVRRPIWETIQELGEGRGVYGPGYEERRRERIKQAYGIDVGENPHKFKDAELPRI